MFWNITWTSYDTQHRQINGSLKNRANEWVSENNDDIQIVYLQYAAPLGDFSIVVWRKHKSNTKNNKIKVSSLLSKFTLQKRYYSCNFTMFVLWSWRYQESAMRQSSAFGFRPRRSKRAFKPLQRTKLQSDWFWRLGVSTCNNTVLSKNRTMDDEHWDIHNKMNLFLRFITHLTNSAASCARFGLNILNITTSIRR